MSYHEVNKMKSPLWLTLCWVIQAVLLSGKARLLSHCLSLWVEWPKHFFFLEKNFFFLDSFLIVFLSSKVSMFLNFNYFVLATDTRQPSVIFSISISHSPYCKLSFPFKLLLRAAPQSLRLALPTNQSWTCLITLEAVKLFVSRTFSTPSALFIALAALAPRSMPLKSINHNMA